ncbi:hypothetical protein K402DRAFT_397470 [Aulographum hederae CBS 113979]|uniref:BTB domain-containing protein n=1 Tax=Aulographum hederae CBS 113979 TaxID=1176131 RepID=A0A6G1GP07_9PEZI|nr:hypothetical protein K402DRAFT_397470 [Aulographum hederae CBS 113979]
MEEDAPTPSEPSPESFEGIIQYFDKIDFSDAVVTYSGNTLRAHKIILNGESEFFKEGFYWAV